MFCPPALVLPSLRSHKLTAPTGGVADEAASGDDSDGDGSDCSDFSSDEDETFFDEQFPGEAAAAAEAGDDAVAAFGTVTSPAELALALERDAALALHPAVAEFIAFFEENDAEGDEPFMSAIKRIREEAAAGTRASPEAHRSPALRC